MPADTSAELLTSLHTRREYSKALLHLSHEQKQLIEQDQIAELIQLIAKKQRVIGLLNDLGKAYGGMSVWWRMTRHELSDEMRADCERVIAQTESILAETLACEQSGTDVLTERRNETQRELMELGDVMQDRRDRSARAPSSQFLDVSR